METLVPLIIGMIVGATIAGVAFQSGYRLGRRDEKYEQHERQLSWITHPLRED